MNFKKLLQLPYRNTTEEEEEENHDHADSIQHLPVQNMFYGLGFLIIFFWLLKTFKIIFIAITLSLFSCFMLLPIIHFIVHKMHWNRTAVSAAISLIYTLLVVFISAIIINNLLYFFSNLGIYENQLNNIVSDILTRFDSVINNQELLPSKITITETRFNIRDYLLNTISLNFYLNSASSFFTFISSAFLVFIFIFFMLNEAEKTSLKLKLILKDNTQKSINKNIRIISSKISRYLQLKLIISFLTALLVWMLLNYFGIENSLTWAFFTFAFNFIPNIGSMLITLLVTLMSVIQFYPQWDAPLIIGLITTAIQVGVGNILDPKLQGDQLDLSPLLILVSLAFWGYIWGVIGLFLAVPMLEVLRITCNNIKSLQPIAIFISSGKNIRNKYKIRIQNEILKNEDRIKSD